MCYQLSIYLSAEEADAGNERVVFRLSTLSTATISDVCTISDITGNRYSLLMKNGECVQESFFVLILG